MGTRIGGPDWVRAARPAVVVLVAVALSAGILVGTVIGTRKATSPPPEAPVVLEQVDTPGADPFLPLAAAPAPPGSPGSGDVARCDPDTLVAYLAAHPAQAQAWVDALDADPALRWSGGRTVTVDQIPAYVAELSPVVLSGDLRVTNHQFTGGRAVAVQSVLQEGTAVLVDAAGVARVRCACGNPLAPMRQITAPPRYVGVPWSGFTPVRVEITVVDIDITEIYIDCELYEYFDGDRCRPAVECPPEQYLGVDGRCYYEEDPCPSGWERDDEEGRCYDPSPEYCDGGYVQRPDEECVDPPVCPDGSPREDGEPCPRPPDPGPPCPEDTGWDDTSGTCTPPGTPACPDTAPLPDGTCPDPPVGCPPGDDGESCPPPPDPGPPCPENTVRDDTSDTCTPPGDPACPDGTCSDPPVTCSGGTTVPAGTSCPEPVQTCPEGSVVPAGTSCPEPVRTCPGGTAVPAGEPCPEPTQTCPDGTTLPATDPCPEPVQTCPDGSTTPAGEPCPKPTRTCPDGTTLPATDPCPEPVQTCPDGSTVPAGDRCPEPVETCPDGSTVPAGEPCRDPAPQCPPGSVESDGVCSVCPGPSPDRAPQEGCGPTAHGRRSRTAGRRAA
jgi:hypothetical protein